MQTSVALFIMEAKYMAASAAIQEAMWQARLLQQVSMRVDLLIKLYEDNKSAIMFTDHPGDHRNTKHNDTRKEFARDAQTKSITELVFVPTEKQLAYGMTKGLPYPTFLSICLNNYLYYYEFSPNI
jgi:hypothetical protein